MFPVCFRSGYLVGPNSQRRTDCQVDWCLEPNRNEMKCPELFYRRTFFRDLPQKNKHTAQTYGAFFLFPFNSQTKGGTNSKKGTDPQDHQGVSLCWGISGGFFVFSRGTNKQPPLFQHFPQIGRFALPFQHSTADVSGPPPTNFQTTPRCRRCFGACCFDVKTLTFCQLMDFPLHH